LKDLALAAINYADNIDKINMAEKFGFPGRFTPYSNIYILKPNTYLALPEKNISGSAVIPL
jgi:hypothetical protein